MTLLCASGFLPVSGLAGTPCRKSLTSSWGLQPLVQVPSLPLLSPPAPPGPCPAEAPVLSGRGSLFLHCRPCPGSLGPFRLGRAPQPVPWPRPCPRPPQSLSLSCYRRDEFTRQGSAGGLEGIRAFLRGGYREGSPCFRLPSKWGSGALGQDWVFADQLVPVCPRLASF